MERIFSEVRKWAGQPSFTGGRVFHGRGHCFPGLEWVTVDYYPPVLFVVLYQAPPSGWLTRLCQGLTDVLEGGECVAVQRRDLPGAPIETAWGALPQGCLAREGGLRYHLCFERGQNVGFFPDMAQGRELVRRLARGKRVLNLFAYTCSFSVAALAGGASQVVNLDMSRGALALGRDNHRLNGLDGRQATFLAHDLFKSFGKLARLGPFDLVVIDPPFQQGRSFDAERDWGKVVRRLPSLAAKGGQVIACMSSPHYGPEFLAGIFARELPEAVLTSRHGAPLSFPEKDPGRGLKILRFEL